MVIKRKKAKRKTKKKRPGRAFLILTPVWVSGIVLFMLYLLAQSGGTAIIPFYEEVDSATPGLDREIAKVDQVIYDSLYQGGIPENNILFMSVDPRRDKTRYWDFTELLIKLSREVSVMEVDQKIRLGLIRLKPVVSVRKQKDPDGEIVFHIFTNGSYTHKIRLSHDARQIPVHRDQPKIALIIDDLGYDSKLASRFMDMDLPLSLSLLPVAPQTKRIAEAANKKGTELILHLPMEPANYPSINPGPGVLLTGMDEGELRNMLIDHLKRVPGARGVNNHMGSNFTQRRDKMGVILSTLKHRSMFWIDSRTTSLTIGHDLAKNMGVRTAERSVFLDNDQSADAIAFQMERLLAIARHSGAAIGIGHPHEVTLEVLKKYLPKLKTEFEVVRASELVS